MKTELATYFQEQSSHLRGLLARPVVEGKIRVQDLIPLEYEFRVLEQTIEDFCERIVLDLNMEEKSFLRMFLGTLRDVREIVKRKIIASNTHDPNDLQIV